MKGYSRLYVGTTLQKQGRKRKIMRQIRKGEWTPGVYLILIPEGEANQLEILPMFFFCRRYPDGNAPKIIGMAFGRKELQELLVQIVQEVYDHTGGAEIRDYFEKR